MTLRASGSSSPSSRLAEFLRLHRWFLLVLVGFSAAVVPTLRDGVGSLDAHNTLWIVRTLVDQHELIPTREPGHPGNLYLLGAIAWLLRHVFDAGLSETLFSTLQWIAALTTATTFYAWLLRSGISRGRACIGVVCLLGSPQFLLQAIDGEEMLFGLPFLLAGLGVLTASHSPPVATRRLAAAILLLAFATTFRAEYVVAAALAGAVHLTLARVSWKTWLASAAGAALALVVLWLPVLLTQGVHNPDPAMRVSQAVLAWGYKLLFLSFGFPASLVLFLALGLALKRMLARRWRELAPADAPLAAALLVSLAYLGLYATHPHKPANVLVALPFLLSLVLRQRPALIAAAAACTALSVFVGVDIFRDRVFVGPRLVPGGYRFAIESKPQQQLPYVRALVTVPITRPSVVIGDAWSWVLEYHRERRALSGEPRSFRLGGTGIALPGEPSRVLFGREFAERPEALAELHRQGYEIVIDRVLWRTLYARYDTSARADRDARIGSVAVRLAAVGTTEPADETQR